AALVVSFHPNRLAAYGHRAQVTDTLSAAGTPVLAAMHVTDDRIITEDGTEHDLPTTEIIEQARRVIGNPAPVSRDAKIAMFEPVGDRDVTRRVDEASNDRQIEPTTAPDTLDAMCGLYLATGEVSAEDAAEYLLNIAVGIYRDAMILAVARPEAMPNQADTLTCLARRAPRSHAGNAYGLAALAHYLAGDTIAAQAAADRATAAQQHNMLAHIIDKAIKSMISPQKMRELLADLAG
ncbi:MAG: DUF4192 family protein, partial [Cumulibacter sp.]